MISGINPYSGHLKFLNDTPHSTLLFLSKLYNYPPWRDPPTLTKVKLFDNIFFKHKSVLIYNMFYPYSRVVWTIQRYTDWKWFLWIDSANRFYMIFLRLKGNIWSDRQLYGYNLINMCIERVVGYFLVFWLLIYITHWIHDLSY